MKRFGVSMEKDLLSDLDRYIESKGFANRSEAIRDFVRENLASQKVTRKDQSVVATLTMIFDHEKKELAGKLTKHQHSRHSLVVSSTHIHLDKHNCLEVIIMKGKAREVKEMADNLMTARGIIHSKLILLPQG